MKLRVVPNVIRLRLGRSEVERLGQVGECRETIRFPNSQLDYVLRGSAVKTVAVEFTGTTIRIEVPSQDLAEWCSSSQVEISREISLPEGALQVLIEKDFRCMDPRPGEDQIDSFENPHVSCEPK